MLLLHLWTLAVEACKLNRFLGEISRWLRCVLKLFNCLARDTEATMAYSNDFRDTIVLRQSEKDTERIGFHNWHRSINFRVSDISIFYLDGFPVPLI